MANPFATLFQSEAAASLREGAAVQDSKDLSALLMRIFLFTGSDSVDPSRCYLPRYLVYLPQLAATMHNTSNLTLENYSVGLAERLALPSALDCLLDLRSSKERRALADKTNAVEPSNIQYLAECYARAEDELVKKKSTGGDGSFGQVKTIVVKNCEKLIVKTASTIVCTDHAKALLQSTNQNSQFLQLIKKALNPGSVIPVNFFSDIAHHTSSNLDTLKCMFDVVLEDVYSRHSKVDLSSTGIDYDFRVLEFFASHAVLSKVLVNYKHWLPSQLKNGKAFETETILGKFLSPSCIAESPQSPSSHFPMAQRFYQSEVEATTTSVQYQLEHVTTQVYKIVDALLRTCPESKKAVISWLVKCLESNNDRGKMASRLHQVMHIRASQASDGFFVNLNWVLLHLCSPFMAQDASPRKRKVRAIDVAYCTAASTSEVGDSEPLIDFRRETKLVPSSEIVSGSDQQSRLSFNFITHCFFLTHKCLGLGLTQVLNKFQDINRNLSRLHGVVEALEMLEPVPGTPLWYSRVFTSQLLGIKAHALHPMLMELCLSFYSTTAQWMVELILDEEDSSSIIPDQPPATVQTIPECIVDNMSNIVMALRQMGSHLLSPHQIHCYISFCTVYMGSSKLIGNPHIRAKLARFIHFIIYQGKSSASSLDVELQKEVFSSHVLSSKHLMSALLSIFVDIEHTGESMEFEDKFMYRLPMYEVLEFLWPIPAYRDSISKLSVEVIEHSEVRHHVPVFLRFINMIINDAILQLDEGLQSLVTIKELQNLQESSQWDSLSAERKKEHEEKLKEAEMYAVNRNKLGSQTVNVLKFITKDTGKPFVIPSIVDRMAAMLNYVLKQLVGKESKNLKVRESEKYHFHPRELVMNIVAVYLNLGQEQCFCEALPRDGRSFSMDLLLQAERVIRIVSRDESVVTEWKGLCGRVQECYEQLLLQESAFENPPEEFLDPLTQELMADPVILPASGHSIDRSSILRHLLSDQHDPFNRAHLTPDMLQPNEELKARILDWKKQQLSIRML